MGSNEVIEFIYEYISGSKARSACKADNITTFYEPVV
jgi:hypothetical protein